MNEFIGFDENDDTILTNTRAEKYKGVANQIDRIAIIWHFADKGVPKFKTAQTHYKDGVGYFKSLGEATTAAFGAPKTKLATFIVHYRTDKQGNPFKDASGKVHMEYEIKEFHLNEEKYRTLYGIHQEFNLTQCDIRVECTDPTYQKMTFTPCNGKGLWLSRKDQILAELESRIDHLQVAREVSLEDLGIGVITSSPEIDVDYDQLMEDV